MLKIREAEERQRRVREAWQEEVRRKRKQLGMDQEQEKCSHRVVEDVEDEDEAPPKKKAPKRIIGDSTSFKEDLARKRRTETRGKVDEDLEEGECSDDDDEEDQSASKASSSALASLAVQYSDSD